jgi:hypothetical protein
MVDQFVDLEGADLARLEPTQAVLDPLKQLQ